MGISGCGKRIWGHAMGYDLEKTNVEGKYILDFSSAFDLGIDNTCFRRIGEHIITWKSRKTCSQIVFFLIWKSLEDLFGL